MNTRKAYMNVVKLAMGFIFFLSAMSMACDDNPCANGTACGLTAPRTNAEQSVIGLFDNNPNDNALP
jgi:hypothetical protein